MRVPEIAVALMALSACASNEELLQRDRAICVEKGAPLGSESMQQCMRQLQE